MTAFEFRRCDLTCNHPGCFEHFLGEEGIPPTSGETRAALRKRAAKAGWTHVHKERTPRKWDRDYCPEHKPAGEPGRVTSGG